MTQTIKKINEVKKQLNALNKRYATCRSNMEFDTITNAIAECNYELRRLAIELANTASVAVDGPWLSYTEIYK